MASEAFRQLQRSGGFALLGQLFPTGASAAELLSGLGADLSRLVPFGGLPAAQYWRAVCEEIDRGAFAFDLIWLLQGAALAYPGNAELRALIALVGGGPRPNGGPMRLLMLMASPTDETRMRLEAEHRELRALARAHGDRLQVEASPATRAADIIPELLRFGPTAVHFAGHGTPDGELLFEDEHGRAVPVSVEVLAKVFLACGPLVCAVFNSCYTGRYGPSMLDVAEFVVGAREPITDRQAIAFNGGFYAALGDGRAVPDAFGVGSAALLLAGGDGDHLTLDRRPDR